MTELLVPPGSSVTPESAGWSYVGFEPLEITAGDPVQRDTGPRECCVVVIAGRVDLSSEHGDWRGLGGRATPFGGAPDAAYLPPGTRGSARASSQRRADTARTSARSTRS